MKRTSLAIASALMLSAPAAQAADMALKAPPPPPAPVYNWTGCYIGGNVGGAWAHQNASEPGFGANQAPATVTLNGSSVIGGAQVGCNVQFGSPFVFGVEGDWSATNLNANASFPNLFGNGTPAGSGGIFFSHDTKWLASIRGRLGYAFVPNAMLYVTGGGAWNRTDYSANDIGNAAGGCAVGDCSPTAFSSTTSGYVIGGGGEWAPWNNNWLIRAEYLYYRFHGATSIAPFLGFPATVTPFSWSNLQVQEVRVGLSYKFTSFH